MNLAKSEYKVSIWKPTVFLYTKSKLLGHEILKYILFAIASENMKYIGINLTRDVLDLNTKICKTLLRKLKI